MPYCPRCGVEVESRLEACPLCGTPIPDEVRVDPEEPGDFPEDTIPHKPLYKKLYRRQKRILITSLIVILGFFPIALTIGLDLSRTGLITWSYYVLVPVSGAAVIVWVFFRFRNHPMISLTSLFLILLAIQFFLYDRHHPVDFLQTKEFIVFIAAFVTAEVLVFYIQIRKPRPLELLSIIFLETSVFLIILDFIISRAISWSLITAGCIFPVSIYFFYLQHSKQKGLNLLGFFFIDLTFLFLALELSISRKVSWSLITSVVFICLGALCYLLHIILFNDTDWRKALHL